MLRALPAAVLRMSALPADRARLTWRDLDLADLDVVAVTAYLTETAADPQVREAIAVSSPSLTHTLDAVLAGRPVERKKLRRAALAVTRYVLRATTRATPFGTLAGVAPVAFGDATQVRVGAAHRKVVRPDAGWLAELVRRRERDLDVLVRLRVVRNALAVDRGDRVVLRYVPSAADGTDRAAREVSVRRSAVVATALELAGRPIVVADLVAALAERFPAAPAALQKLVAGLVEQRLLLTELAPPPSAPDPLAHVLALLPGDPELIEAGIAMADYAEAAPDEAMARWRVAARGDRHDPHVDLAVDAEVTLPREVAAELERAVAALVRMTPADTVTANLHHYRLDFLERYGDAQLVPLLELLDPMRGLDAPAGYTVPRSTREVQREARVRRNVEHDRLRGALAQQALLDGSGEVVLDDAVVDRLALDDDVPPPAIDLGVEVQARSVAALDRGDFRLVMWSSLMAVQAGALSGRFAHLVGGTAGPVPEGAIAAQLEFTPAFSRSANLSRVPRLLEHRIPVGLFADGDDPGVIGLDDLAVGADRYGLYLWSLRHDTEVVPQALHMLDMRTQAPNVVRFLCAIAATRQRGVRPWDWGAAGDQLAHLPRVRYGRTVLSAASWRVDRGLAAEPAAFDERLDAWRKLWRVPDQVALAIADSRVGVDLDRPLHRALLRHELGRGEETFLVERSPEDTGWLDGHAAELVVSLRSGGSAVGVRQRPELRPPRLRYPPGSEWVYVKVYAPEERHRRLVTEALEDLRSRLPAAVDRWFFLRYADPLPHLRVRVHGPARELVEEWADALCAGDLAQTFVLDTYEPEVARYGGIELLEAAERAFHADSEAAVAQLRLAPDLPSDLLVAANLADVAAAFGGPGWREWFLAAVDRDRRDAFRAVRERAVAVIADGQVDPRLREIWAAREPAVRAYGDAVRARGVRTPLGGLLHMTHIRLAGISPPAEERANAIARGAVEVAVQRERHRPR
ncbi:lantibiotic dehydratase [Pseudonocardia sp. CA-107938]|uniref:lantibiotic dehydratase n=1 Tax=Pseudonocardia sp. CA-107938 TaxID=3240021 RepID=UPI003D92CFB8